MRQFYTLPINTSNYNVSQSIKESYRSGEDHVGLGTLTPNSEEFQKNTTMTTNSSVSTDINSELTTKNVDVYDKEQNLERSQNDVLTKDEIDDVLRNTTELPTELTSLITSFISELKQPKYAKPLTIIQLASLFQIFYTKFDKSAFEYLSNLNTINSGCNSMNNNSNSGSFFNARESLSTGLSGIFARSRSSSVTNNARVRNRRSSSLFSIGSNTNNTMPLLSPEEISRQLKSNAINNIKIDKFMELCEKDIFKVLLEVGTAVSAAMSSDRPHGGIVKSTSSGNLLTNTHQELFNVATLFRNTNEFIEFDKLLHEKIKCLSRIAIEKRVDLCQFLGVPDKIDLENEELFKSIKRSFHKFNYQSVAPCEKIKDLLKIHTLMVDSKAISNDEFLSMLIYYIIRIKPKKIFLNEEFIKLFRYKKKLVESELYALTNLEAALMFIEGLTLSDFSDKFQSQLNHDDIELFTKKVSDTIMLPLNSSNDASNLPRTTSSLSFPEVINPNNSNTLESVISKEEHSSNDINNDSDSLARSKSYEGFRSVFDSSLKNIISKMKSYTPPAQDGNNQTVPMTKSNSNLQFQMEVNNHLLKNSESLNSDDNGEHEDMDITTSFSIPSSLNSSLPQDWRKFKDIPFEELKIADLKVIYEVYQKLNR